MPYGARSRLRTRPLRRARRASSDHSSPHGASATHDADLAQQQVAGVEDRRVGALQHHHHQHRDHRADPRVPADHRRHARHEEQRGTRRARRRSGRWGRTFHAPGAERALVHQVALHEEGVDVGEQADRPDRRGGTPADPHQRHRRGALGPEEEAIPERHPRGRGGRRGHEPSSSGVHVWYTNSSYGGCSPTSRFSWNSRTSCTDSTGESKSS